MRSSLLVGVVVSLSPGCGDPSCLRGLSGDCTVVPACDGVAFACDGGTTEMYILESGQPLPLGGQNVLAAPGDVVLANDYVVAVLDALDHPHYVAPTGGTLLDLGTRGGDNDALRNLQQAIGVLPGEAMHYTQVDLIDEGEVKAVQFRGFLDGFPDVSVATRYEIRPCDRGIRIRTELVHGGDDPLSLWMIDGFYWGGREHLPLTPGAGFDHPSFGLTDLQVAFREIPWMVGAAHAGQAASYGLTGCDTDTIRGFQSAEISAVGLGERVLQPRDVAIYERYVTVADGPSSAGPVDLILEIRDQLFDEAHVTVSGRLIPDDGGPLGDMVRATLVLSGPDGPVSHLVPGADGAFSLEVPAGLGALTVAVEAFGLQVATFDATVAQAAVDLGDLQIPGAGTVTLEATVDGIDDHVYAAVHPADEATLDQIATTFYGFEDCAPLLGNPWGASPACNRVLIDGPTEITLPDGRYDVFAAAGPGTTLARVAGIDVASGTGQSVLLELVTLPLIPEGVLSADLHVHGRASFDSSLPDDDRVRAFLAARVDVVASTDHDVVNDYAAAVAAHGAGDRMALRVGVETTGHILQPFDPSTTIPKVVGHFIFWPVPYDPEGPWRGAPWDELVEPGGLFTRVEEAGWPRQTGVIQLNHPWGGLQFGRDFAWPTAMGLDLTRPLSEQPLFSRTPEGATFGNAEYHVQEVMNGTANDAFLQYRAVWHYLLSEGVVRGGTANSDSHSLSDNVLGTPRTLVWADTTMADFDPVAFDAAVRSGRMVGTNGPVLEIETTDATGSVRRPSVEAFVPADDAVLSVRVTAAPWVPVEEVRVIVDGEVAMVWTDTATPPDPFGTEGLDRLDRTVALSELVDGDGDHWIVVEAGAPLVDNADLDCNGVPDTGDTDGNGTIDWRDVADLDADPEAPCFDTVGPLAEPDPPDRDSAAWWFDRVTPGGAPTAFTNPLILDVDGDGYEGVNR